MKSYLFVGCGEFGGQLLPQLVQLLPEHRLLLLQRVTLLLELLLQLLRQRSAGKYLSEQRRSRDQRGAVKTRALPKYKPRVRMVARSENTLLDTAFISRNPSKVCFTVLDREMRKLLHCYHNKAYYGG